MNIATSIHLCVGSVAVLALTYCAWGAAETDSASRASTSQLLVYFGTYTGAKSKGIYVSHLELATGKLTEPELAVEIPSPSFVAIHPSRQFLYAVNEVSRFEGKRSGAVSAFVIDRATGRLTLLNQQPSGGDGPCHLNVDATGKDVLVANYNGGSCGVLPIQKDGRLEPMTSFVQHRGSSANKQRQSSPHAHGIYLDARNRFAFVPDLGLDRVMSYHFDSVQGSLAPNDPPFATVAAGSGPRHFAFDPAGKHAYVINEILCTITAFNYDAGRGKLEQLQTISTLPDGQAVLPQFSTAEIEVHPTGKYLYGSNRGHDTLAVFGIDPGTGKLKLLQHQSTQGKTPRGFGIDPSGQYLVAANQDSDNVIVLQIDPDTGRLTPTGQNLPLGSPVCVKFMRGAGVEPGSK